MLPNSYKISAQGRSATKTVIGVRGMSFVVDKPVEQGGTGEGPNPMEYMLGGLAGCLNITAHMAAKALGISIYSISFDIEGSFDRSEGGRAGFESVSVTVNAETSEMDDATRANWLKNMERVCSVTDNLKNATPVQITLK